MKTLLLIAIVKAILWPLAVLLLMQLLPLTAHRPRRVLALTGVWGVLVLPWLVIPTVSASLPVITDLALPAIPTSFWWLLPLALWLAGAGWRLFRLSRDALHWHGVVQRAQVHRMSQPQVRLSSEVQGPCLTGVFHPVVLMPVSALQWSAEEWQCALRHETEHARLHDGLHRVIAALVAAVWWWNPLVQRLAKRLEIESEIACDLAAVTPQGDARAYGRLLLSMAMEPVGGTAVAWAARHSLRERIERLLARQASRGHILRRVLLVASLACVALTALLALRCSPETSAPTLPDEAALRLSADPFPGGH